MSPAEMAIIAFVVSMSVTCTIGYRLYAISEQLTRIADLIASDIARIERINQNQ